jgi:hypothetical protein
MECGILFLFLTFFRDLFRNPNPNSLSYLKEGEIACLGLADHRLSSISSQVCGSFNFVLRRRKEVTRREQTELLRVSDLIKTSHVKQMQQSLVTSWRLSSEPRNISPRRSSSSDLFLNKFSPICRAASFFCCSRRVLENSVKRGCFECFALLSTSQ